MMITNSTNRRSSKSWFPGKKFQRNPQEVNSLIYKDYTLVEHSDGSKTYVSPEEKAQLLVGRELHPPRISEENEKMKNSSPRRLESDESESDSGYEIPVEREKPKSCNDLDKPPESEMKQFRSLPFSEGKTFPGDNGRINLPPYLVPLETSLTLPMTKEKQRGKRNKKKKETEGEEVERGGERSSSTDEGEPKTRFSLRDPFKGRKKKRVSSAGESPEDAEIRQVDEGKFTLSSLNKSEPVDQTGTNTTLRRLPQSKAAEYEPETEGKNVEEVISEEPDDGETVDQTPETDQWEHPIELPPENLLTREKEAPKRTSGVFSLPKIPSELLKPKERRASKSSDPNPLKKMFGMRGGGMKVMEREPRPPAEEPLPEEPPLPGNRGRYDDADLSQIRSDTESADHGSADKSSVSKLTSERQPKKLMSGLLGSFRKGRNKDRVGDNDAARNPSAFEIAVKEQPEDADHAEAMRTEGIVYAELDMARSPGSVMTRRDDEKTEYAEIIYPGSKLAMERPTEELRKSRENLTSSRENLTEVDEAFSTSPDGKKEAAV